MKVSGKVGWWETDLDSSSDTLTPQRSQTDHLNPVRTQLDNLNRGVTSLTPAGLSSPGKVNLGGPKPSPGAVAKPLLPFSVTPPKPSGQPRVNSQN